jgi:hypothetical protein
MQIKSQPAPAILGQESVHTTLSTTHDSQERPSTGPRMLRSSVVHLYQTKTRFGTNVPTFVPASGSDRYKCEANTFVPSGATNRARGHLYRVVAPPGTNAIICTRGKYWVQIKNQAKDKYLIL